MFLATSKTPIPFRKAITEVAETVERIRFTVTVVRNSTLLENLVELIDQRNYS